MEVPEGTDWKQTISPASLAVMDNCMIEPSVKTTRPGNRYQFERLGYFCVDQDSTPGRLVFNRTVSLKDTWAKIEKKSAGG
jgi:glutaminyl-tRNA synthetase